MAKSADPKEEILVRNLKKFREEAGLTQEEAARAAGESVDNLRRWERGEVGIKVPALKSLADVYGHTMDDFYLVEPPPARLDERPPVLFRLMPGVDIDSQFQQKALATIEKLNREWREIQAKKPKRK